MTCNLLKYDHISQRRGNLQWLSISSFIRYRSMLTIFDKCYLEKGFALESPILFGVVQHSYRTRCPKHFAAIPRCRLNFTKRFFDARLSTGGMLYHQNFFMVLKLFPATYLDTFLISLKLYIWFLWLYLFYGCICFTVVFVLIFCCVYLYVANCGCICN